MGFQTSVSCSVPRSKSVHTFSVTAEPGMVALDATAYVMLSYVT